MVEVLRSWFFPYFGVPRSIVTDKGKENENSEIQALTKSYNIDHIVSSTSHPQSNGMVERRQSMILQFFHKTCNTLDEQANWNKHCAELQTIINSTKSATREHSPFFLTFFQNSNYPLTDISMNPVNYNEASTVAAKLNLAKKIAKNIETITEESFQKYKQQFDKDIQNRCFFPGCTVYVYTTQRGKTHWKLFRPYKGPYKCIAIGKNNNLLLELMKGGKTILAHKNNCKMAPFREQFFDIIRNDEHEPTRRFPRHPTTSKLFKYSAFHNPGVASDFPTVPPNGPTDDPESGEDAFMEQDQSQSDTDSPTPPAYDPN